MGSENSKTLNFKNSINNSTTSKFNDMSSVNSIFSKRRVSDNPK